MKDANNSILSPLEILEDKKAKIQKKRSIRFLIIELAFTAAVIVVLVFVVFGFASVNGNSMYPALRDGDLVMYYRLENQYQASDVIAFELNGEQYVKRIVAVAGDEVNIDNENGYLLVNGSVMSDDIMFPTKTINAKIKYPYTVPKNCVFVLGDNREHSTDSRSFSAIPLDCIHGKLMIVIRTRII